MNTAITSASKPSLAWRFAWKEYRMLRGLWLAGFVIAIAIQSIPTLLQVQKTGFLFFPTAWGAAAIYAVGAAIIMFAAETEDRTRDYLRLLPGDWRPIFLTKASISLATAILLGCALSLTGRWFAGNWLSAGETGQLFGVFGIAVLEFLVWGLLFSMWWKHPLLAAVAAIACASFGAQLAIGATEQARDAFSLEAYQQAVPARLLICLAVLAMDVLIGRHWLYPSPRRVNPLKSDIATWTNIAAWQTSGVEAAEKKTARPRLRMFSRLVWQTWRESWRSILVAVPLSFGLMTAAMLPVYIGGEFWKVLPFVCLILPALLGALVFRADWQRDHRLFLASHAARPRYVWLARQVVWFAGVLALAVIAHSTFSWMAQARISESLVVVLNHGWRDISFDLFGRDYLTIATPRSVAWGFQNAEATIVKGLLTAWCAFVAAYSVGQLCSMLLKQSLLSGFLAILLSIVLAAWSVLMFVWQMNPLWFVLPVGVTALLATWLRAPYWILQKNEPRHWLVPAGVIAIPLTVLLAYVPVARMAQINNLEVPEYWFLRAPLEVSLERYEEQSQTAREFERKLEQLGIAGTPWIGEIMLDGKKLEDFDLSDRALEFYGRGRGSYGYRPDQLDPAELEILDRFQAEAERQCYASNRAKLPELLSIINSPEFTLPYVDPYNRSWHEANMRMEFSHLLAQDAQQLTDQRELEGAWQRLKAIPLLNPEYSYRDSVDYFQQIMEWAAHPNQTSSMLETAIADLQAAFDRLPDPRDAILAAHLEVRQVVLGENAPRYSNFNKLSMFLMQLPGERQRAIRGLDLLTTQALNHVDAITTLASYDSENLRYVGGENKSRQILRTSARSTVFAIADEMYDSISFHKANELAQAFATSFLAAEELDDTIKGASLASQWIAAETRRCALLVRLALLAHGIDHGEYPETLEELVPDYLPQAIHDPFSGESFEYRPRGLSHKLLAPSDDGEKVEFIPAETPLIWSVGYDNMQLVQAEPIERLWERRLVERLSVPVSADVYEKDEEVEELVAAAEAGEKYHYFRGTERGGSNRFVFPLPKNEPVESKDAESDP